MFTLTAIAEYVIVAVATALLFALCTFTPLGALQQAGYDNRRFFAWLRRKGNMLRSRYNLLALLILLSSLVLGICFSFTGKWAAYLSLVPVPLFVALYDVADRRALKVPLETTARVGRIYALEVLVLAVLSFALTLAVNAVAYYAEQELVSHLRYLPLAVLPVLLPYAAAAANALEKPFSARRNKKYLSAASEKLAAAKCVKIGITGSCGKTSVKNFLAAILSVKYKVLATPASYNTPLGIARAVEKEDLSQYDFFLAEMGARHRGDISALCSLVRPDHCMITCICPQHLESFGTVENIVAAKGEILAGTKKGGFAVIGQDELSDTLDVKGAGLVKVSVGAHGEFGATKIAAGPSGIRFTLAFGVKEAEASSKLLGVHNADNIALAAAMAYKLGMSVEDILEGISRIDYVPHRLQPYTERGVTILDDAYNANVRGAAAALDVLRSFAGRKIVVTPGLVELGVLEQSENAALGEKLAGLDLVLLVGDTLVTAVRSGYLAAGGDAEKLRILPSLEKAQEYLEGEIREGDVILFLNDLPDIYN